MKYSISTGSKRIMPFQYANRYMEYKKMKHSVPEDKYHFCASKCMFNYREKIPPKKKHDSQKNAHSGE